MKFILMYFLFLLSSPAFAELKLITTTPDLSALVKKIVDDKVQVRSIAKGTQDIHQIEAKPSFMIQFRDANLVISQGLDLEDSWLQPLIQGSRNPQLIKQKQILELGPKLNPIEKLSSDVQVSRANGDVHPLGNPHFQLDPIRMGEAAILIAKKISELDPQNASLYLKNGEKYQKFLVEKTKSWQERVLKAQVQEIVTYHKTFSYFCDRFKIKCELQIEPKPGIPPTASHLMSVIKYLQDKKIKHVLIENYFSDQISEKIKKIIPKIVIERVAVSVTGLPQVLTTEDLIEALVSVLEKKGA